MSKFLSYRNDSDWELALSALATYPTPEAACEYLLEYHDRRVTPAGLEGFRKARPERWERIRRQLAPKLEQDLADGLLDNARMATVATNVAIQRTMQLLQEGKCQDPSRVARDLADVQAKSVDKRLALEGRPTQITETRNTDEIIRALEGMKVVQQIDVESTAIEEP